MAKYGENICLTFLKNYFKFFLGGFLKFVKS